MAKNKKRKKTQTSHYSGVGSLKQSKTFLDTSYAIARRIFQAVGEDPAVFDVFSKRQKQEMFRVQITYPRVLAMPGHKVPRPYIRFIQEELFSYLKSEYFNRELGLTWMDMITTGQTLMMVLDADGFLDGLPEPQREVADRVRRAFEEADLYFRIQKKMCISVKSTLMMISQPNFRIYGQNTDEHKPVTHKSTLQQLIRITTHESQSLRFRYRNRERIAYRLALGPFMTVPYMGATIAMSTLFPNISHDRILNIYVQSHALHRFKERIDTFYPILRNQFLVMSLMIAQRVVRSAGGLQLIACISPHRGEEKAIGYFAFTIDGDNLLVLTLLPLLSRDTPEGRVVHERLGLSAEDLKYLGMDRLSFFYDIDIAQIPALKKVLFDELHLDYIRELYSSYRSADEPFDAKKTLFVKNFFRKLEDCSANHAEILEALEDTDTV
jgi:hypothetical protein